MQKLPSDRKIRPYITTSLYFIQTCNGIKELILILNSAVSVAMNLDNFSFISRNKEIKRMHKTNGIRFCMLSIFSGKCSTIVLDDIDKIFYCSNKKKLSKQTKYGIWMKNAIFPFKYKSDKRSYFKITNAFFAWTANLTPYQMHDD